MPYIYEPKGKAREYSPLALNVYADGCDHACDYCYCKAQQAAYGRTWQQTARPRRFDFSELAKEAAAADRQVLLSFVSDPYCRANVEHKLTRRVLEVLCAARCSVAILTKGGSRCLSDLDLFARWSTPHVKVGATLTFRSPRLSLAHEPGAALPEDRIEALRLLHEAGVKTWASIEPVLDPVESLAIIRESLPFVDAYKVGKLNHQASSTDWLKFCVDAVTMIRLAGKTLYVKDDLRAFAPAGYLTTKESTPETVYLPDRQLPSKPKVQGELF